MTRRTTRDHWRRALCPIDVFLPIPSTASCQQSMGCFVATGMSSSAPPPKSPDRTPRLRSSFGAVQGAHIAGYALPDVETLGRSRHANSF